MAIKTNPKYPAENAALKTVNFAKNPAVAGMPANDNMAKVNAKPNNGFLLANPLNLSKFSPSIPSSSL